MSAPRRRRGRHSAPKGVPLPLGAVVGNEARDEWKAALMADGGEGGLSAMTRLVGLAYMRYWNHEDGWTYVSTYTIAADLGMAWQRNVDRPLRALVDAGYLWRTEPKTGAKTFTALTMPPSKRRDPDVTSDSQAIPDGAQSDAILCTKQRDPDTKQREVRVRTPGTPVEGVHNNSRPDRPGADAPVVRRSSYRRQLQPDEQQLAGSRKRVA